MKELTTKQLKRLFVLIEINVLMWLSVCGAIWSSPSVESHVKYFATVGTIIAALLHHWAYHNIYKRAKGEKEKQGHEQANTTCCR
ncbi:MAG TPA: hypothetical protein P5527_13255 [Kiritimatiellia bacterium]|nr:hypothetical protein [Kiritimatiellia bacterium]